MTLGPIPNLREVEAQLGTPKEWVVFWFLVVISWVVIIAPPPGDEWVIVPALWLGFFAWLRRQQ